MIPEKYENGQPPKEDNNPDKTLQNRTLIDLQILSGLEYDAKDKKWEKGSIYDPKSGKTYDRYVWLENNDLMKLQGFVAGIRMLGRCSKWYRTELLFVTECCFQQHLKIFELKKRIRYG